MGKLLETAPSDELERNVGYVIKTLENKERDYVNISELTIGTRLAHSREEPLGLKDARDAIAEAKNRGLVRKADILGQIYYVLIKEEE